MLRQLLRRQARAKVGIPLHSLPPTGKPLDIGAVAARGKVIDALPVLDDRAVADDASIVRGKEAFASAAHEPALPQTDDVDEAG
jgi:hypothetical protein